MKMHRFKRILSLLLVAALLAGFYVPGAQAASTGLSWKETDQPVRLDLSRREVAEKEEPLYQNSDVVRVSIVLEDKPTIQAGFGTRDIAGNARALAYGNALKVKQDNLAAAISAQVLGGRKLDVVWNLTLAANLISARIPYGHIETISRMDGVKAVVLENRYEPCVVDREEVAQPQMYASLGMTGSSLTWGSGYTGAGSRVAVVDTGTDTMHQSLNSGAYLYALEQNAKAAGLSYEEYVADLDLLDAQEIASVLSVLNISKRISGLTAADLYLSEKLPFAANYVDSNLIVDHKSDYQGEHGSHVAGIAAANRYIPSGSSYADALQAVSMAGVAPDAQLITMKVFGDGSPYDSDYMAAIEDAIYLNCDSVNLSLGTSSAGMSYNPYFSDLLEYMAQTDTVVVASAGNSSNWPAASLWGYLYHDDASFDIVGAPGSHSNFFTVASVENDGGVGPAFLVAGNAMLYGEVTGYGNSALGNLDISDDGTGTDYEYVFVDGLGYAEDYAGMDLNGKVVFCSRGTLNFADKANNAMALGATAVIVYNNAPDGVFGMNLTGISYSRPCVSLSQQDADTVRSASAKQTTSGGLTYYTGKITILANPIGFRANSPYYTMSDFSSWGVPGTLELKPEITAPGGNIYSLWGTNTVSGGGTDKYEVMSGTSMAAPAITGMAALVAQYLRETGLAQQEGMKVRHLAQSLLMSTAEPLYEAASGGQYYSLLNQGAGMGRVDLAVSADSYILVDGQADGKVKAELGDDPNRTGVYTFSFSINNLTDKAQSYMLSADVFRQDMFEYQPDSDIFLLDTWTAPLPAAASFCVNGVPVGQDDGLDQYDLNGDGVTNALDADYLLEYLLGNETKLYGEGDVSSDGMVNSYDAHVLLALLESGAPGAVNLPAGGSVTVDVTLTLTAEGKQILENNYPNGTYVEAFVYAEEVADEEGIVGTVHSIPVLAFYGNWSDPSMYDRGTLLDLVYMTSNVAPYLYRVVGPYGNALSIDYGNGTEYYFGGNPYLDDDTYLPQRNAFNSKDASFLGEQSFTLIRNASAGQIKICNAETGEEYLVKALGDQSGALYSAYYSPNHGEWLNPVQYARLNWKGKDASGNPVAEDTLVNVTLTTIPEYYRNEDGTHNVDNLGKGTELTTQFSIDNTAPTALDIEQIDESTLRVTVQDNRYVAAVALLNASGTSLQTIASPNQTEAGVTTTLDLDLTGLVGKSFLLLVGDYAMNETVYEITLELPEVQREYFTAIDCNTLDYVGINTSGTVSHIVSTGLPLGVMAAEYVGGYVFLITEDFSLCVASDDDLSATHRIGQLDPDRQLLITTFNDMAYNYVDGKLYAQFYSELNYEAAPYLCTIDMYDCDLEVVCELPVDVNTMAIDTEGNFYSAGYDQASLYTYTLADVTSAAPTMTYIGEMGYYRSAQVTSMAWDHNEGRLYWAYPNTLLKINPKTAEPTLIGYHNELLVGLYIRPENSENMFAPVNTVDRVVLNYAETRVLEGYTLSLEATVWPWNASDRSVTWTSSDSAVASVDGNGMVTGIAPGTAVITATSRLNPTKSASCTIIVESLPAKELNGIVWDELGEIWMSKFRTDDLPNYTKLHANSLGLDLAAATMNEKGEIYAASLDMQTLKSNLYKLDPTTFEPTYIGPSTDAYMDLAPAPGQKGNSLMAVYGGNVLMVDADSGDYYFHYYMFQYNLVGLAYAGTMEYKEGDYDTMIDWYFIVDRLGYVYLMGFLEQDGSYYYMEHDQLAPGGIYTQLGFEMETPYFGSAYFDGQYLYFSAYRESTDNVTLMAVDVAGGTKKCYTLGTFEPTVWPVAGLMELGLTDLPSFLNVPNGAKPTQAEDVAIQSLKAEIPAKGGLNVASGDLIVSPKSTGEYEQTSEQVVVTLTGANALNGSTNGRMTVSYNADELKLVSVTGTTEAFAYAMGSGTVEVAYASADVIAADAPVATLTFEVLKSGDHEIVVRHHECDDEPSGKEEFIHISSGCSHSFTAVVTEPTCENQGYTTYTCTKCGESYVSDYTDPVDHVYEDGHCKWCGEDEQYVRWYSGTTSLNGTIDLNIYVLLSQDLVEADDTYVRFIHNGNIVDVPMADALYSPIDGYTNRYRFSCPIYAKQLADQVTVSFMKGNEQIGKTLSYSVVQYCVNQLQKVTDPQELALYKAMLNYGAAAQLLFDHNVENLANASLSDADKVLPSVDASAYKYAISGKEEGIRAKSATLMLEDVVKVRVYFALTGTKTIEDYTFTIDGKVVTPMQNEKGWYVETDGIAAKDLEKMFSVQVGGITVKYGALSFVNSKANGSNQLEANISKALFVYWQAAESYLG